jgi:hypothetical protein
MLVYRYTNKLCNLHLKLKISGLFGLVFGDFCFQMGDSPSKYRPQFTHYWKWRNFGKFGGSIHPKKISSGVDNWYLDEFFEEFICGRWYIYLEQAIYHLCRPISCWLSSLTVEYHLLWTIISFIVWYSSPADDIQLKQMILIWRGWYSSRADKIQLKQMILICRGRYSSRADDYHPMETILIQERRISSMMVDSWNYNQPLEMIYNHWGW